MPHVCVLGAGPCGMSVAREIIKDKNITLTILEKEDAPGGLCRSVEYKDYRFDLGGHRFITSQKDLVDDIRGLLGDDLLISQRKSSIFYDRKLINYPLEWKNLLATVSFSEGMKIIGGYLKARTTRRSLSSDLPQTIDDWFNIRFGPYLNKMFFAPYTEKLWGVQPNQMSSDWAGQRIPLLSMTNLWNYLFSIRKKEVRTYAHQYFYPRKGIGQIFTAMRDQIIKDGGTFHFGTVIRSIGMDGGRIGELRYFQDGREWTINPDFLISTIPLTDLVPLMPKAFAEPLLTHCDSLTYRSLRFLNMLLPMKNFSDRTWTYIQDPSCLPTRIQEPKRRSPDNAPPDMTSVILEIPCFKGDAVWSAPDEELAETTSNQLAKAGFPEIKRRTEVFSTFAEHAYPIYKIGYAEHRKAIVSRLHEIPNLLSCGRQGSFAYIFMDSAMIAGRNAARMAIRHVNDGMTVANASALLSEENGRI